MANTPINTRYLHCDETGGEVTVRVRWNVYCIICSGLQCTKENNTSKFQVIALFTFLVWDFQGNSEGSSDVASWEVEQDREDEMFPGVGRREAEQDGDELFPGVGRWEAEQDGEDEVFPGVGRWEVEEDGEEVFPGVAYRRDIFLNKQILVMMQLCCIYFLNSSTNLTIFVLFSNVQSTSSVCNFPT